MKYLICSDIHGSESACKIIVEQFQNMNCDKLIILGDILYHGPRNPLPQGHNPKGVVELLNPLASKIFACRGNCDAEVDQMVLSFPVMADFVLIVDEGVQFFCSHGHVYAPLLADGNLPSGCPSTAKQPKLYAPAVVFYGHTHVSVLEKNQQGIIICNPGSTSLPKGDTEAGFAVYENKTITLYNMEGKELKNLSL